MTEEKSKNILVLAKELGVSHDDIREFLLKQKKPISEQNSEKDMVDEEIEQVSEEVSLEVELPEIEEDETETIQKESEEPIEEVKEPLDIETQIKEEVIKQLKVKRKTPSKGKIVDSPSIEYGVSNRGYEELV